MTSTPLCIAMTSVVSVICTLVFCLPTPRQLYHAHENLRRYARLAILPQMPSAGRATTTTDKVSLQHSISLRVVHETHRVLRTMHSLEDFVVYVTQYNALCIPDMPRGESDDDRSIDGAIRIPVSGYDIRLHHGHTTHLDDIEERVMFYPLQTARRMMQLVYPATVGFYLRTVRFDKDPELIRCITWASESVAPVTRPSMMVFVQAPWILTEEGIRMFAACPSFPDPMLRYKSPLEGVHRLWAKIYDGSSRRGSHWFVLTTYDKWVFGVFSRGYTTAWVSPVLDSQCQDPTILECLMYWFSSSISHSDGWNVPEVRAEQAGLVERLPATTRSAHLRCDGQLDRKALLATVLVG